MRHFDLFTGYGGFTLALQNIYVVTTTRNKKRAGQGNPPENKNQSIPEQGDRHPAGRTGQHGDGSPDQGQLDTVGFSEIDKYASAVLTYHWPKIKNYGDITKIKWQDVPDFDLLTGGSPCQDLSIAGKRAGLDGKRSGLFFEFMRAVKEKKPRYFIWENVKGALSSNSGKDFAAVIHQMAEAGYSLWWQVLNAKDFGVPQNRERVFVVGVRDGSAPEILFEPGDRGRNLKEITKNVSDAQRIYESDGIAKSQKALGGGLGAKTGLYAIRRNQMRLEGKLDKRDICPMLKSSDCKRGDSETNILEDFYPDRVRSYDHCPTLRSDRAGLKVLKNAKIRRLTPTECERLMGLPDGWTAKGVADCQEFEISDSQRYKLCGNGVVVNVVEAIIKNIIQ